MDKSKVCFIFGARDAEMQFIKTVCDKEGIPYAYACAVNPRTEEMDRINAGTAYNATHVILDGEIVDLTIYTAIITIECAVEGVTPVENLDHHREGDFGFGFAPELYETAASVGQFMDFAKTVLHMDVMARYPEWKMVAAGDHCPAAAYQGECPGISVEDFREFRLQGAADFQKKDIEELRMEVGAGMVELSALEDIVHMGFSWKDATQVSIPQLPHVAAMLAMPAAYTLPSPDGRTKCGIIGSNEPAVISAWMNYYEDKLVDMYGDPARGYAGGYLP